MFNSVVKTFGVVGTERGGVRRSKMLLVRPLDSGTTPRDIVIGKQKLFTDSIITVQCPIRHYDARPIRMVHSALGGSQVKENDYF